jgi:hypothetical protein
MIIGLINVLRDGTPSFTPFTNITELTASTPDRVVRSSFMKRSDSRKSEFKSGSSSETSVEKALNILVITALNPTEFGFEVNTTWIFEL